MLTDQKLYLRYLQITSDIICCLLLNLFFLPFAIAVFDGSTAFFAFGEDCIYKSNIYLSLACLLAPIPSGVLASLKVYARSDESAFHSFVSIPVILCVMTMGSTGLLLSTAPAPPGAGPSLIVMSALLFVFSLEINRLCIRHTINRGSHEWLAHHIAIVGTGPIACQIGNYIAAHPETGLRLSGFLSTSAENPGATIPETKILGKISKLPQLVYEQQVDCILVPPDPEAIEQTDYAFRTCSTMGIGFAVAATKEVLRPSARITKEKIHGYPFTLAKFTYIRPLAAFLKRVFDFTGATALMLISLPFWLVIPILIKADSPGPVFFRQERIGKYGRRFTLYKFRSMHQNAEKMQEALMHLNEMDGPAFKIKDDPRLTLMGKFLRKFSLDELPQLFNVFRGDISLVGPRPAIESEVRQYRPSERRRLSVTQGITCIWQVSGRNDIQFDEWMKLDLIYIDSWSSAQDFKILFKTVPAVITRKGAY